MTTRAARWLAALGVVVLAAAVLGAGCAAHAPADLARTTPFALAHSDGHFVRLSNGLQMFAITKGVGRDVVLLHGNGASTYSWRKIIEPLATRYRVHAIDLPGYGFSDKPDGASYAAEWQVANVVAYLDAAGVQRAILVGNSMGGHVATETAILHPERVAALVLLGASGLPAGAGGGYALAVRMATWPVIGPVLRTFPFRGRIRTQLRAAVYDPALITEADVDAVYAPFRSRGGTNAYLARMGLPLPSDRAERVRTIIAPTLVMSGDSDRLVAPEVARRYHELIGGSELLILEQTGHLPQEERPERVVAEIERFVAAHP